MNDKPWFEIFSPASLVVSDLVKHSREELIDTPNVLQFH